MLHKLHNLIGQSVLAKEGEIGKVEEFYFDDQIWIIRYLILKTGHWLNGRRILIPPIAILNNSFRTGSFQVNLSKEQIRVSPEINTDKPVSRQQEIELYGHYSWQGYWESCFYEGGLEETVDTSSGIGNKIANDSSQNKKVSIDIHLRSSIQVTGYPLLGTDGEIGEVEDFIIDDTDWQLTYLNVCRKALDGGKDIRVPIGLIKQMQWNDSEFYFKGSVNAIKDIEAQN